MNDQAQTLGGKEWLILGVLFVVLFSVQSFVTHRYLVAPHPGANDYYSRWAGARALLVDGRDPYDLAVTQEIQKVIGVDPAQVGRGGFHYPLHVLFFFWPLVYLSYPWAQAIWQTFLIWVVMGTVVVLLAHTRWRPAPLTIVLLMLGAIFFYPVARSVLLGQFTLHVTLFLALSLWLLQNGRDGWAGLVLAAASIKPQMIVLIGVWMVLWMVSQRRWRFVWGLVGGGVGFLLASLVLFPPWPLRFIEDVQRYSEVAGGRNPLSVLLGAVLPGETDVMRYIISALLIAVMLYAWWRAWRRGDAALFETAVYWTIIINTIVPFQTGTTNQAILLIPLFVWMCQGIKRWGAWPVSIATTVFLVTLWALFFALLSGDYENPLLFVPTPLVALAVLTGIEINGSRRKKVLEA